MIKKLKYKEVDWVKYTQCLEQSEQYVFFAEKKYLDLLIGENWDVLVYGNYQAIMPIPKTKKWGVFFVVMPMQTQQMGVFSKVDKREVNDLFYHFLMQNYLVISYAFNVKNNFNILLPKKRNFVLDKKPYQEIRKKYSVHRRRNVRILPGFQESWRLEEAAFLEQSKDFFLTHLVGIEGNKIKEKAYLNMKKLSDQDLLQVYNLYFNKHLASQAYLLKTPTSLYLINFINDRSFIKKYSSSIILDQILQLHITNKHFDFHGSNLPEIAEFYRRFGAREENYPFVNQTKKQLFCTFIKKKIKI